MGQFARKFREMDVYRNALVPRSLVAAMKNKKT